jgi:general secretion pathway protein L
VRVEALRYDADRGVLAVTAVYGGFDDFETLRAAAEAAGVSIEDSGTRQGPDGVVGDFLARRR